mgnify:CR=1 FL=1
MDETYVDVTQVDAGELAGGWASDWELGQPCAARYGRAARSWVWVLPPHGPLTVFIRYW